MFYKRHGSQGVVPKPVVSAPPENLLEMPILRLPSSTELKTLVVRRAIGFAKPSR